MPEYIEREAVQQAFSKSCQECHDSCIEFDGIYPDCEQCLLHSVKKALLALSAADVAPVVHGKWIKDGDVVVCSNCGEEHSWENYRATFCEDCGAKMDGKEGQE